MTEHSPVRPLAGQSQATQSPTSQSMTGDLQLVLVCPPCHAGWDRPEKTCAWRDLRFGQVPDFPVAQSQHEALCRLLTDAGAEVLCLPNRQAERGDLTLDAVYTHDSSMPTDYGLILMRPGKPNRVAEAGAHAAFYAEFGQRWHLPAQPATPIFGEITPPATAEAGDIVWLDTRTLLVGYGYRTNREGIRQLRTLLAPKSIEVNSAPLPHGQGPGACLHLMSLMSMLDEQTILVDLPRLAVETVELLTTRNFRLIEIDYGERDTLACNVLSLGSGRLIALQENARTNSRLCAAGFDVRTFPGSEICLNGSGGPTCLTRPLVRSQKAQRPPC